MGEEFEDLDGVESGAFEELVTNDPEADCVFKGAIEAESADAAFVIAGCSEGCRVEVVGWVVFEGYAGEVLDGLPCLGEVWWGLELGGDGDGMGTEDWDSDAGYGGAEVGEMENSAAFVLHFHFLAGVAVVEEGINLGDDVECDGVRVNARGGLVAGGISEDLLAEFFDGASACAGDGLVTGGDNGVEAKEVVEGGERHEGDGGGAVGICNDAVVVECVVAIDFGDNEGDVWLHAECGGIVYDDCAGSGGDGGELFGDAATGREESKLDTLEGIGFEFLDWDGFAAEEEGFADGASRGKESEGTDGEVSAFEDAEHFFANGACCANDCQSITGTHGGNFLDFESSRSEPNCAMQSALKTERANNLGMGEKKEDNRIELMVSVGAQRMRVLRGGEVLEEFVVSTSKYGTGSEPGSYRTPLGRFRIARKIGHNAPLWSIFRGRERTGELAQPGGEEDLVLTRILWLDGLEPGNANTMERYIYIHGTNREDLLGQPASHGCVRMANADVARLFEWVEEGTEVRILPEWPESLDKGLVKA